MSAVAIGTRVASRCAVPAGTALMERVCSYCRDVMGWVVCSVENNGERTHGVCGACAERELAKLRTASAYLRSEYTLEIGAAGEEPATQAATPHGDGAGAANDNATNHDEALRSPVSSPLPAASGAPVNENTIRGVLYYGTNTGENVPDEQGTLEMRKG